MGALIKIFLIIIALVIVIAVIIFGGKYLELPLQIQIILIAAAILIWALILFLNWWMKRRRAKAIEKGILMQAEASALRSSPARRSEIDAVKKNLEEALAMLKRGPQGKGALYAIPWYMIIGPPATGKTTAIVNSGLNFPNMTTAKRMRGAGGTRNCDWWLSTDAILLDTAGRYAQSEDRSETEEEWFGFLDLLRRGRGKGPINGLILAYSIETVIQKDEQGIVDDARELRQRMDEMLEHLGWSFPVYLLFTKADLIAGFVEFFENLSPMERQHAWGATVTLVDAADQGASERFDDEIDTLLRRIREVRTRRMVGGGRGESWGKVFLFPEEVSALRPKLHLFVETLFEANPFRKDAPLFRGFYFSSGKQVGQPFEIAVRKIQTLLGLRSAASAGAGIGADFGIGGEMPPEREDAYFVRDIFAKVLRADRDVSRRSSSSAQKLARWQLLGTAALIVVSVLMSIVIGGYSYASLARKMDHTRKRAEEARASAGSGPTVATLERLEALRKEVRSGWHAGFLTAPGAARERAGEIYDTVLRDEVLGPLEERIASQLRGAGRLDGDEARQFLRAELHLVKTGADGIGHEKELPGTLARQAASGDDVQRAEELLQEITETFLDKRQPIAQERSYELRAGAERLRDTHAPEPFFDGLVGAASRAAPDITVASLAPGQEILQSDARVRAAFSKAGWEKSVSRDVNEVVKLIDEDKRLLALAGVAPSDRAPTKEQLLTLYDEAFAREWARFLESIRLPRYSDCDDAKDDFKELQSPAGSPIAKLLQASGEQTELGALLGLGGQEKVATAFEPLHTLVKGSDKEPAPLDDYMKHLEEISDQIADCAKEKDYEPEAKVFRKAKEWPGEYSDRFPSARLLGESIESFLAMPAEIAERLVGGAAAVRVGEAVEKSGGVRDELKSIARFYPFASGGDQATIDDVKAFFGSDGAIETFRQEWVESGRIEPTPQLNACFDSAERIRRALSIDEDEMKAPFTITVEAPRSDGTPVGNANLKLIDRITIVAAGEKIYARAPFGSSQDAVWSTAAGDAPSSIVLEHTKGNQKIGGVSVGDGLWSWFELLDKASSEKDGSAVKFTWAFEDAGIEVDAVVKMRGDEVYFAKSSSFRRFTLPRDLVGSE